MGGGRSYTGNRPQEPQPKWFQSGLIVYTLFLPPLLLRHPPYTAFLYFERENVVLRSDCMSWDILRFGAQYLCAPCRDNPNPCYTRVWLFVLVRSPAPTRDLSVSPGVHIDKKRAGYLLVPAISHILLKFESSLSPFLGHGWHPLCTRRLGE